MGLIFLVQVPAGQDVLISVYNIHHNPSVWDDAEEFIPERFGMEGPVPSEATPGFRQVH